MLKKSMERLKNYIPLRKGGNSAINNITDTTSKQLLQNTIYTMSLDEFTAHIEDYTDQTKLEANRDDNKESGRLTKLLPTKDGYGEDYLYRGMAINAEELKNIITKE